MNYQRNQRGKIPSAGEGEGGTEVRWGFGEEVRQNSSIRFEFDRMMGSGAAARPAVYALVSVGAKEDHMRLAPWACMKQRSQWAEPVAVEPVLAQAVPCRSKSQYFDHG